VPVETIRALCSVLYFLVVFSIPMIVIQALIIRKMERTGFGAALIAMALAYAGLIIITAIVLTIVLAFSTPSFSGASNIIILCTVLFTSDMVMPLTFLWGFIPFFIIAYFIELFVLGKVFEVTGHSLTEGRSSLKKAVLWANVISYTLLMAATQVISVARYGVWVK
jgi:hypothetical protein